MIVESLLITTQYHLWLENDFNEIKLVYDMSSSVYIIVIPGYLFSDKLFTELHVLDIQTQ